MLGIRSATAILGRRETLRCIGLGALGSAAAVVVGACGDGSDDTTDEREPAQGASKSVKAQTLAAFAKGTWKITFPTDAERTDMTLTITNGKWKATNAEPVTGTWAVAGGTLQVNGWGGDGNKGTATEVPDQVDDASVPASLPWTWEPDYTQADQLDVALKWDKASRTMRITGVDADGGPLVIEARRV